MSAAQAMERVLDVLCPMHLALDATGHIAHVGPTLRKLRPDVELVGQRFLEVFMLKRPRAIKSVNDLRASSGMKLHLQMRDDPQTELKGLLIDGMDEHRSIINLSFGFSVVEAVGEYGLTSADFSSTDLTIEMLYLIEAKSAAMEASRKLNQRLQGAKIAAEEQAFTDTLTGLKNRRAMDHVLARHLEWDRQFALMHLDLDYFKDVNDSMGHAAGDHVLQTVARVMVEETRDSDTVARVGGDEFVILLPDIRDQESLIGIGRRIIKRLEVPIAFQGQECRISASIGTVFHEPDSGYSAEQLFDDADVALYASKHAGRAQQTFYSPSLRNDARNTAPPTGRELPKSA
ncbi:MAG: GGDEF domain-containing protein [Ascidiaceihabitans sp.]|nr:GGDEF domain-containing protein [Ascidiaceihabitans sp.]